MADVLEKEHLCVWVCMFRCFNLIHGFIRREVLKQMRGRRKMEARGGGEAWDQIRGEVRHPKTYAAALPVCPQDDIRNIHQRQWKMNSDGIRVGCYLELEKNLENKEEAPSLPIIALQGEACAAACSALSSLCLIFVPSPWKGAT